MSSVECGICGLDLPIPPKMPLQILEEDGKVFVSGNLTAVYNHMRIAHPERWTDALAAEYEQWKKS
jgi:hypothetical protein